MHQCYVAQSAKSLKAAPTGGVQYIEEIARVAYLEYIGYKEEQAPPEIDEATLDAVESQLDPSFDFKDLLSKPQED